MVTGLGKYQVASPMEALERQGLQRVWRFGACSPEVMGLQGTLPEVKGSPPPPPEHHKEAQCPVGL